VEGRVAFDRERNGGELARGYGKRRGMGRGHGFTFGSIVNIIESLRHQGAVLVRRTLTATGLRLLGCAVVCYKQAICVNG
jgi:hypothetical protein